MNTLESILLYNITALIKGAKLANNEKDRATTTSLLELACDGLDDLNASLDLEGCEISELVEDGKDPS